MGILEEITFTSNTCFKGCWHTTKEDGMEQMSVQKQDMLSSTILTIHRNSFHGFYTAYFYIK
jgi:hypothetical protein